MIFLLLCIYPPLYAYLDMPKLAKLFKFPIIGLHVCTLISYQFLRMLNPDIVFLYDQFEIVNLTKYFISNGFMNESDIEKLSYQILFWLL